MMPKISMKSDVRLDLANLEESNIRILRAALVTAPPLISELLVVTSADDSLHSRGSLHFIGRAFDLRCFGDRPGGLDVGVGVEVTDGKQRELAEIWVGWLSAYLGSDYDVVLESDHIHVEYDPDVSGK